MPSVTYQIGPDKEKFDSRTHSFLVTAEAKPPKVSFSPFVYQIITTPHRKLR